MQDDIQADTHEDTKDDQDENEYTLEQQKLRIRLLIAEDEFNYKIERRPLVWFWTLYSIDSILIFISSLCASLFGGNSYVGGWGVFIAIVTSLIFIGMTIYFFMDYDSYGEKHGFKGITRIRHLISSKEAIERLQIRLRVLEEFQAAQRPAKDKYAEEMAPIIRKYTRRANRNRRIYYFLQLIIIFCSLLVTGLTSGLTGLVNFLAKPWVTPAISFSVSFLTAMVTLFRFRERGHNLQLTSDAVEYEISCATKRIYGYKNLSEEDAYTKLAEEVERLVNEQRKRQQQLEQASETKQHTE